MKKNIFFTVLILLSAVYAEAQDQFKLSKSSGHLVLNLSGVVVEGYSGSEIIFMKKGEPVDERAKGLTRISSSGLKDNTGLGLSVVEANGAITVKSVSSSLFDSESVKIKVPENIKITFNPTSSVKGNDVIIDNMKSELEISVSHGNIKLNNNTGPVNAKSLYGEINARFKELVKGPISLVSLHGSIDLSLTENIKANVDMATVFGKIFASERFKIAVDEPVKSGQSESNYINIPNTGSATLPGTYFTGIPRESIKGKINGGGVDIILKSTQNSIYLRTN